MHLLLNRLVQGTAITLLVAIGARSRYAARTTAAALTRVGRSFANPHEEAVHAA